jgi:hypothetical protein
MVSHVEKLVKWIRTQYIYRSSTEPDWCELARLWNLPVTCVTDPLSIRNEVNREKFRALTIYLEDHAQNSIDKLNEY